eukprot:GFUD01039454.1.p1 GENE.GFUD01039454.1~~GFUD01039454.1.p1  ORF type:complete len:181 (+),score=61.68 GFUD01039454.1:67-609(+)
MSESKFGTLDKSHISRNKICVRFVNRCPVSVSVSWINFSGEEVEYGQLEPEERYNVATYGTHPWVFRALSSQQLMGVQFHGKRCPQFEAYRFVSEKQQLGYLSGEQVGQVLAGRCVVSVAIVTPCYTLHTLRQRSLLSIATLLSGEECGSDSDSDCVQDRVARLGLPATLQHRLMVMLRK